MVPGSPLVTATVLATPARAEVSSPAESPFNHDVVASQYESTVLPNPARPVPASVADEAANGLASDYAVTSGAQPINAAPATDSGLTHDNFASPQQPMTVSRGDRDIFGRIPGHGAAHMNTFLSETIPMGAARSSPPFSAGWMRALGAFPSCDCFLRKI